MRLLAGLPAISTDVGMVKHKNQVAGM